MEIAELKKIVANRPFKAFEIHLDNGEVHLIKHPEIIITDTVIATVDENGELVLITPEAVSSIKILGASRHF